MSSPRSMRRRAKRLVKHLFSLQRDDAPMTATTLLATKYLLRNSKLCAKVEIINDYHAGDIDDSGFGDLLDSIPIFILCQLEDQKLTLPSSPSVALTGILSFIISSLPCHFARNSLFPTQFRWQCSRTHRTHVIFAYISTPMNSRVYSIQELMSLRSSRSAIVSAAMASKDPEIAGIVLGARKSTGSLRRSIKKSKDDSSTGSDEVLYRGNAHRRQVQASARASAQAPAPALTQTFSKLSKPPVQVQVQVPVQPPAQLPVPIPIPQSVPPASQPQGETEWKYRGRSGSEVAANGPLSAPCGLIAQQSEGFQRFYKAVVSPTHVRVTAGGRIVPNTRGGAPSPTSRRIKDGQNPADGHSNHAQPNQTAKEGISLTPVPPMPPMHPMHPMPQFFPGFAPGVAPMGPFPMMPRPMSVPGVFPYPIPPMAIPAMSNPSAVSGSNTLKDTHNKRTGDIDARKDKPTKHVNLSPPDQFDHTKPFVYNGQWMYPVPPPFPPPFGGWFLPPHMGPGHNFAAPPPSGGMMMPPPPMSMPAMVGGIGPHPSPPMTGFPAPRGPAPLALHPPPAPPISSIRLSEITARQLSSLRASLKYHEDQLQYNKHQIDEKDMENKIKMLKVDIERFERMRQAHLDFENTHYPNSDKKSDEASEEDDSPKKLTAPDENNHGDLAEVTSKEVTEKKDAPRPKTADVEVIRSSEESFECKPVKSLSRAVSVPAKTSALPSGAALAPPFKPRSDSLFHDGSPDDNEWNSTDLMKIIKQQLKDSEKELLHSDTRGFKSDTEVVGLLDDDEDHGGLGVPYLIGTLPQGVNPRSARSSDYVYSRQLTEDEIRARYLYWGNAPRSVQHGLPKFDGKNFYPPSPYKAAITPKDSTDYLCRRGSASSMQEEYGTKRHHKSREDPFEPITPSQAILAVKRLTSGRRTTAVSPISSFSSQTDSSEEDFRKALEDAEAFEERQTSNSFRASEGDVKSAGYQDHGDRRSTGNRVWHGMMKRGLTSSDVLPSTVSSTTAQGYLPQYGGNAAASLSPRIANATGSRQTTSSKPSDYGLLDDAMVPPSAITEKRGENRPPLGPASLEESFRNIISTEAKQKNNTIPPHWNA